MGNHTVKKKQQIKKKQIGFKKIILLILIILVVIFVVKSRIVVYNNDEISLIIENKDVTEELKRELIIQNDIIYMSFEDVKNFFDNNIYIEDNLIITTSNKKVAAIKIDDIYIEINGSTVEMKSTAYKTEDGVIYIPISELKNVYDMQFSYIANTNNIVIDYYSSELKTAQVTKDILVKQSTEMFSQNISKVKKDSKVAIIEESEGWTKIKTEEGIIGYVKSSNLTNIVKERENFEESNIIDDENMIEKDINKEDISSYEKRKKVINEILFDAVNKKTRTVKVNCDNSDNLAKFKLEAKPILKECGINVKFN